MTPDAPDRRPLTFPQHLRMKTPAQFKAVYDRKKSASDGRLIVFAGPNGLPHPRLGLSVSRKVGGAVVRNRFRRLLREAFRLAQYDFPSGVDFVVVARPGSPPTQEQIRDSLLYLAPQAARRLASAASGVRQPPAGGDSGPRRAPESATLTRGPHPLRSPGSSPPGGPS